MPRTYGATACELKPAALTTETLSDIGRLVRAFAEIEDILDLHIACLAGISETKVTILLGRTAISRRMEIAETLARLRPDKALEVHLSAFKGFGDISDCRNAVAHGKLLGVDDDGKLAFLTFNSAPPSGEAAIRVAFSYHPETIKLLATTAEAAIPTLERMLQVEALRAERLLRPLQPHSKARVAKSAKPPPPPQS
jgi:hypothetical protein